MSVERQSLCLGLKASQFRETETKIQPLYINQIFLLNFRCNSDIKNPLPDLKYMHVQMTTYIWAFVTGNNL